jgi:hypothetical protein
VAAVLVASCTREDQASPSAESSDTAVSINVTPATALDLTVGDHVHITAAAGSFSSTGAVTATLSEQPTTGVVGVSVAGRGVDITFTGTRPVRPLQVEFTDVSPPQSEDAIPTVLHQLANGDWETELARRTDTGGIAVDATTFSLRLPSWLDPRRWLADRVDSVVDSLTARTDPPPCSKTRLDWATLKPATTLMHSCLISNIEPKSKAVRAEVQLSPNRRFFVWSTVPEGVQYAWLEDQPEALRVALGHVFPLMKSGRQVLVGPGTRMTSGAPRPASDRTLTFTAFIDGYSAGLSLAASLLGLIDLDPPALLPALGWLTAQCADEVPSKATDVDGSWGFTTCVAETAVSALEKPEKAVGAAVEALGDRVYAEKGVQALQDKATQLRLVGKVLKTLGLVSVVRDIWAQIPDAFSQMGADRPGDIALTLRGRTAQVTANVVSLTGFGPAAWGSTRARAEIAFNASFSLQDLGNGCSQAHLARYPRTTFGIQDGRLAAVAIADKSVATDTGLRVGDPVSALSTAYPGVTSGPDPSDAASTRYRYTKGNRTAQFTSYNGKAIDVMQFGFSTSVGEYPCV